MKHLIIISLLMTLNCHAQDGKQNNQSEEPSEGVTKNQKRPSWSQGLPERQSPINPSTSMSSFKVDEKTKSTSEDDLKLQDGELPSVEIDLVDAPPLMKLKIEPVKPTTLTRQQAFDEYYSNKKDEQEESITAVNPLIAEYKWTPIKTTPIDVTDDFDGSKAIKLKIQINPKGHVTRVTDSETTIPRQLFKSAEKSILNWRFQAPSKIGITENISKTFSIDINTDA